MVHIGDWKIEIPPQLTKIYSSGDETLVEYDGEKIAVLRITPRGALAISSIDSTFYIDSQTKTITVSFNRDKF